MTTKFLLLYKGEETISPTPWSWAGLGTFSEEWNAAELMLSDVWASVSKGLSIPSLISHSLRPLLPPERIQPTLLEDATPNGKRVSWTSRSPQPLQAPQCKPQTGEWGHLGPANPQPTHQLMEWAYGSLSKEARLSVSQTANPQNCDQTNVCCCKPLRFRMAYYMAADNGTALRRHPFMTNS